MKKENKPIIFDCDGTLVESETIASHVYPKYWATHGVFFTKEEFKEVFISTGRNAEVVIENFAKMPDYAKEEGDKIFTEALKNEVFAVEGVSKLLSSLKSEMVVASNSSLNHVK